MSSRRATLTAQLAQLSAPTIDPDAREDELLGAQNADDADEVVVRDRNHYLDVGPSRMRRGEVEQTLRSDKYGGEVRGRQKIFDDDDDEESSVGGDDVQEGESGDEDDEDEDLDEDEGSEEAEEDDEEDDGASDEYDEEEDDEEEDQEEEAEEADASPTSRKTLDPLATLRDARSKDVLKGQAIKRQRALFETLTTMRITFQKALTASAALSFPLEDDGAGEVASARTETLASLRDLNERLFVLRQGITLPAQEAVEALGKRKRDADADEVEPDEAYWTQSASESLALGDVSRAALVPILSKWSTKIQAASLSVGGKSAGSSKFLAGITGQTGVLEAIEAGMASRLTYQRADPTPTLTALEDPHYRALLREIISSRTGASSASLPTSSYRLEKKKKRDAERGASKGRKIRYTVHEKAQNFAVAQPLRGGWGEEQTDELFASLLGGAGMAGGRSEVRGGLGLGAGLDGVELNGAGEGLTGLGGLRVF